MKFDVVDMLLCVFIKLNFGIYSLCDKWDMNWVKLDVFFEIGFGNLVVLYDDF